jgi:hypothetical protein
MTSPEPSAEVPEEPPIDPSAAIEHAYRFHRAKRRVRDRRRYETRKAHVRFYAVLMTLVFVTVLVALTIWNEIQRIFGL